jgi:Fic family protein
MVVYGDSGSIDSDKFLEYIAKQFPLDLAQLVKTKDELAKRQGALSAVDKANKDREKAAAELDAANAKASSILADAQAEALAVQAKKAEIEAQAAVLEQAQKAFAAEAADKTVSLMNREQQAANREAAAAALQADYTAKLQVVEADRAALNVRIKAFQDKVAALSV